MRQSTTLIIDATVVNVRRAGERGRPGPGSWFSATANEPVELARHPLMRPSGEFGLILEQVSSH
jgi:hypothetical protein